MTGRQLAAILVVPCTWLGLDLVWRSNDLLAQVPPLQLASNGLLVAVLLFGLSLPLGTAVARLWPAALEPLSYALLVYLYLLYVRLFVSLTFSVPVRIPAAVLAIVLLLAYPWLRRAYADWLEDLAPRLIALVRWGGLVLLGVGSAAYFFTPSRFGPGPAGPLPHPHVLLLTADSLSARHMSLYGYARPTTPNLEQYGRKAFVFENMVASCNGTRWALRGVLGSRPHESEPNLARALASDYPLRIRTSFSTIDARLNAGFTGVYLLKRADAWAPVRALGRGPRRRCTRWLVGLLSEDERFFNLLSTRNPRDFNQAFVDIFPTRPYLELAEEVLRQADRPAFLWVHLFNPHFPYYSESLRFGPAFRDRYDAAIYDLDSELGPFLESLEDVLVVFTADHGQSVNRRQEAGWTGTMHGAHWSNLDVESIPLLVHLPGQKEGARPLTFATHADLAPTIVAVLGLKVEVKWPGEALIPYWEDPARLSERVRLGVPESYFTRQLEDLEPQPRNWASNRLEQFQAYQGRHRVVWLQQYAPDPERPKRLDQVEQSVVIGVYDLLDDPECRENLVRSTTILGPLMADPLAREFLDARARVRR